MADTKLGTNIVATLNDKGILTIKIDTTKSHGMSKSGKSEIVATTGGNQSLALLDLPNVKLGVNCYQ